MLIFIFVSLVLESIPAITEVGPRELFSTEYSSCFTTGKGIYGILGALYGTFLVVVIAVAIALPASLAMAVFSSEFPLGFLGRMVRGILGALSGIPPIVYALMGGVAFAGLTAVVPTYSTFTAGFLLALLVIPFMAPLIDDAIRNVPYELKEASLALGVTRWHTLRKVTLPLALSGIVSATTLGVLKAMGDVMIAIFAIGYVPKMPHPFWDILDRTAPLTSTGAGLARGLAGGSEEAPEVGYFTCLMLLVIALAILALATLLQQRLERRFSS
jgi:phosphate transport system permease protein